MNLVDLVETPQMGAAVKIFPNLQTLHGYKIKNKYWFLKEDAYAGGVLQFLLWEILYLYAGKQALRWRQLADLCLLFVEIHFWKVGPLYKTMLHVERGQL